MSRTIRSRCKDEDCSCNLCLNCNRRNKRFESFFCSKECKKEFEATMCESISCVQCSAGIDDVLLALSEGWREIVADSEAYGCNYLGVCPDCVKEGYI
jgi:hypothetical protein